MDVFLVWFRFRSIYRRHDLPSDNSLFCFTVHLLRSFPSSIYMWQFAFCWSHQNTRTMCYYYSIFVPSTAQCMICIHYLMICWWISDLFNKAHKTSATMCVFWFVCLPGRRLLLTPGMGMGRGEPFRTILIQKNPGIDFSRLLKNPKTYF